MYAADLAGLKVSQLMDDNTAGEMVTAAPGYSSLWQNKCEENAACSWSSVLMCFDLSSTDALHCR